MTPLSGGAVRVTRGDCAVDLREEDGAVRAVSPAGILMGDEIGALVDGGFQKFFRTPSGKKKPALADELKALHEFEEDVAGGARRRRATTTSRSAPSRPFISTTG